jgi:hypothetical protein
MVSRSNFYESQQFEILDDIERLEHVTKTVGEID